MLARSQDAETRDRIAYEKARDIAQSADPRVRASLAARADAQPEVLYFLAGDESITVRRAIAANPATPVHADALLARDADDEVRGELARKIGRLLPNMGDEKTGRLRDLALSTMQSLAQDQVAQVRAILAEELKLRADAPREIVLRLANDLADMVAAPILEYSPLLSDADLVEIIAKGQLEERLSAIARRQNVSESVSDAIVATMDVSGVATLLANPSAQIREETLDAIVDSAAGIPNWHKPLVFRNELSLRAVRRIASFVAASLIDQLAQRHDLPDELRGELRQAVSRRVASEPAEEDAPEVRAQRLHAAGRLDDEAVVEALDRGDREFAIHALSLLSGMALDLVRRAVTTRSAKAIVSLSWRSGLTMRTAIKLQTKLAYLAAGSLLNARYGTDYPLSEDDMDSQLAILAGG
jgi:uncharacterized protein (DUF2336 family)